MTSQTDLVPIYIIVLEAHTIRGHQIVGLGAAYWDEEQALREAARVAEANPFSSAQVQVRYLPIEYLTGSEEP